MDTLSGETTVKVVLAIHLNGIYSKRKKNCSTLSGWPLVREILFFFKVKDKVREFCKIVREILNTKKVWGKSRNFQILAQNCSAVGGI